MFADISDYPKKGKRKIKVHISSDDTYSMDYTLAIVILPALKAYKKVAMKRVTWGCFFPPNYHEMNKKDSAKASKAAKKQMKETLDKMIFAFEKIVKDDTMDHETEIQEGLDLFGKYYRALWW